MIPLQAHAQSGFTVEGRIFDAGNGEAVQNAVVTLEGIGSRLTTASGSFRFDGIEPGEHLLRVEAFGYTTAERGINVLATVRLEVALEPEPLSLDEIRVEAGTLDFDGRVRDPGRHYAVKDAEIMTDQGHEEWSNAHGRFDLDDVLDGRPLRLVIRAFGYLPVDTTFLPDDEERYTFDLGPDPVAEGMIDVQHRRLADRAGDLLYRYRPALDRDGLARYMGTGTLETMVEAKYPPAVFRSIECVVLDDRVIRQRWERERIIRNTIPEDLERIEVLEVPGPGRAFALRVYTRRYFQRLIAGTTADNLRMPVVENPCR